MHIKAWLGDFDFFFYFYFHFLFFFFFPENHFYAMFLTRHLAAWVGSAMVVWSLER